MGAPRVTVWWSPARCELWARSRRPAEASACNLHFSLDGIIQRFSERSADQHFDSSDGVPMFRVPVLTFVRDEFDDRDAGIVHAHGEPRFDHKLPQLFDLGGSRDTVAWPVSWRKSECGEPWK